MNRKTKKFIIILLIIILHFAIFTCIYQIKNKENGNNIDSQEIVNKILNISSYEITSEVKIISNKNENTYVISQKYINSDNSCQEIIEPNDIAGTKIIRENGILKIENTKLNVSTTFDSYGEIVNSSIDLSSFIESYKKNSGVYSNEDKYLIMECKLESGNIYNETAKLYIEKNDNSLKKLEIKDKNQKTTILIKYIEVRINN